MLDEEIKKGSQLKISQRVHQNLFSYSSAKNSHGKKKEIRIAFKSQFHAKCSIWFAKYFICILPAARNSLGMHKMSMESVQSSPICYKVTWHCIQCNVMLHDIAYITFHYTCHNVKHCNKYNVM